ncbi:GNAT family acetyltransferase YhhY [Geomicrobium sp. JCM 19037]|uniref:GNAT family N-acetyltransferase n=1 Tax=unclassified Geomicrobium TaxID=2628951 RepID=UPI00045F3E35|nr:GNAT family N-acetyltransferase [Geomicrobium sp. JCM 19037]GAK03778.1 GNAT family acetyltransferase YhhY [Geomicrobium sp. JCM 19037]
MAAILEHQSKAKNQKPILIQTATVEYAEQITDFLRGIFKEAPYLLTAEDEFTNSYTDQERFLDRLYNQKNALALVAIHNDRVIGFLDFHGGNNKRNQHDGTLGMSVHKDWRNQGVGDELLKMLKQWAAKHLTIEKISLEVFSRNIGAIHLYIKHGFNQEGRKVNAIKMPDGSYSDLIIMGYATVK